MKPRGLRRKIIDAVCAAVEAREPVTYSKIAASLGTSTQHVSKIVQEMAAITRKAYRLSHESPNGPPCRSRHKAEKTLANHDGNACREAEFQKSLSAF